MAPTLKETYMPAAHEVHEVAPVRTCDVPGPQLEHAVAPTPEYVPAAHGAQAEEAKLPVNVAKLPAQHPTHAEEPVSERKRRLFFF